MEWWKAGRDSIMRGFMTCTIHQVLLRVNKSRKMRWASHITRMTEIRNVYGRGNLEDLGVDERIIFEWILEK